jgi:quinol monooxygenase YgiN
MKASTVFLHTGDAQTACRRPPTKEFTMSTPLTLLAELKASPGQAEELGARLQALVAPTRREAGCLGYALHRSSDDPDLFVLYENWRSRRDLDQHLAKPYLLDFFARAPQLLAQDVSMRFFSPAAAGEAA